MLAHQAQDLGAGQGRTHRIAIGTGVRGQQETAALIDMFEDLSQHIRANVSCVS